MSGTATTYGALRSVLPCDRRDRPERKLLRRYNVVALHGLQGCGGNGRKSWTSKHGGTPVMWLKDLLPDLLSDARIMEFTYDFKSPDGITAKHIGSLALKLLDDINWLESTDELGRGRLLIFVGHDLGGVIIKQALSLAARRRTYSAIIAKTARLIFFATPHRVHDLDAWDTVSYRLMLISRRRAYGSSLQYQISNLSSALQVVAEDFDQIAGIFDIVNVHEDYKTDSNAVPLIIGQYSATLGLPASQETIISREKPHLDIATFSNEEVNLLKDLFTHIRLSSEHREELVECLTQLYSMRPHDILIPSRRSRVGEPTRNWFKNIYRSWVESKEKTLTIHGTPGAGRTELATFIIGEMLRPEWSSTIGFSFDSADDRRNSAEKMLASLAHQLICQRPELFDHVVRLHQRYVKDTKLSIHQLWTLCRSLLSCSSHDTIICILNCVDECDESTKSFITRLKSLASKSDFKLKLILTAKPPRLASKNDPNEASKSETQSGVAYHDMESEYNQTVLAEISSFILENPKFRWLQDRTAMEALLAGGSTILQTRLKLVLLRDSPGLSSVSSMKKELSLLPVTTDELYQRFLGRIPLAQRGWADKVLLWVSLTFRPIKIEELSVAIALSLRDQELTAITTQIPVDLAADLERIFPNILRIERDEVMFIHRTLRDYLLRTKFNRGHFNIARLCLRYLSVVAKAEEQLFQGSKQAEEARHKAKDAIAEASATQAAAGAEASVNIVKEADKRSGNDSTPEEACESLRKALESLSAFSLYAIKYWPDHYQMALSSPIRDDASEEMLITLDESPKKVEGLGGFEQMVASLLEDTTAMQSWAKKYRAAYLSESLQFKGDYLLVIAARAGCHLLVDLLLDRPPPPSNETLEKALEASVEIGDQYLVGRLMKGQKKNKLHALLQVVSWGHLELLPILEPDDSDLKTTDDEGLTMLHRACTKGRKDMVENLLNRGSNIEARTGSGATALHIASQYGYEDIVDCLIDKNADLDASDNSISTPLHLACKWQNPGVVKMLLAAGATVDIGDEDQCTPVHIASSTGRLDILKILFEYLSEKMYDRLTARTESGSTPVHLAASNASCIEHAEVLKELLSHEDAKTQDISMRLIQDDQGNIPLHLATMQGRLHGALALLETVAFMQVAQLNETNWDHSHPIHLAVSSGHAEVADLICRSHKDNDVTLDVYDASSLSPLHIAARNGDEEIARSLVDNGASTDIVNGDDETPLMMAFQTGFIDIVRLLLDNGADPSITNGSGRSALHIAAESGHLSAMIELDHQGATSDVTDNDRHGPLHLASKSGKRSVEVITYLVDEVNLDLSKMDNKGRTPVSLASEAGNLDVVRLLMEKMVLQGKAWDEGDSMKRTPFLYAAKAGKVEVVRFFLVDVARLKESCRTNIDAVDCKGRTSLFHASKRGHEDVVDLLLEHNADPNMKDKDHYTALHKAVTENRPSIARKLLAAMRKRADAESRDTDEAHSKLEGAVNSKDSDQKTPMYYAAYHCREEIMNDILSYGISTEVANSKGSTPLLVAYDRADITRKLLEAKAIVDWKNDEGETALSRAVEYGYIDTVKTLLEYHANPLVQDEQMNTPLHVAARTKQGSSDDLENSIIHLLLDKIGSASVDVKNNKHETPLFIAIDHSNSVVVRALLERLQITASPGEDEKSHFPDSLLLRAAKAGDDRVTQIIIDKFPEAGTSEMQDQLAQLAISMFNGALAKHLIERGLDNNTIDEHGWSLVDIATPSSPRARAYADRVLPATCWVIDRMESEGIHWRLFGDGLNLACWNPSTQTKVKEAFANIDGKRHCSGIGNHPLHPNRPSYFEVSILRGGEYGYTAVGLCTGLADGAPGLNWRGSCAYHGDNGRLYENIPGARVIEYSSPFGSNDTVDVIGCYYDPKAGTASFSTNGEFHGASITGLRSQKLFPVVYLDNTDLEILGTFSEPYKYPWKGAGEIDLAETLGQL